MLNKKINLLSEPTEYGFMPYMETYILDGEKRPAVLVIPGGGYSMITELETERIALSYNAAGFHAAVVYYCVSPHTHPLPILNAARAMTILRENAEEWGIDTDKIIVCGFSAGGHLAASLCTLWNDAEIFDENEITAGLHKPNAAILCYPVITSGEFAHKKSFKCVTGTEDEKNYLWNKLSLENRVSGDVPPTFLWHTYEDKTVPVENSLMYASALKKAGVPFELHIFDKGWHGMSLVSDNVIWSKRKLEREYPWLKLSSDWANQLW